MRNLILKIAISTFTTLVGSCFSIILINDIRHRAYGAEPGVPCQGGVGVPWYPLAPPPSTRVENSHNSVLAPPYFQTFLRPCDILP